MGSSGPKSVIRSRAATAMCYQSLTPRIDDALLRLLMAIEFQAFVDESESQEEFVLGGYIAPVEVWAKFAIDWERLLPLALRKKDGSFHFKMSEMALGSMERVQAFYGVIDQYEELIPISFRINMPEFRSAYEKIDQFCRRMGWSVDHSNWTNPYYFSFRMLLNFFHGHEVPATQVIPEGGAVDFIFDNRSEKRFILSAWNEIVENTVHYNEIKLPFGHTPRFENDQTFLPLQAADLWAWWVREWYEEDSIDVPDKMQKLDFGTWRGKPRNKLAMSMNENQIIQIIRSMLVTSYAEGNFDPMTAARRRGEL
jgi:hypothetical protein